MSSAILKSPIENKTWALAFLLTLIALAYGIFEIWTEQGQLSEIEQVQLANQSVYKALQNYSDFEQDFINESEKYAATAKQFQENNVPTDALAEEAVAGFDFWGLSLFRDQDQLLWTGFAAKTLPTISDSSEAVLSIEQNNNVTFLQYRTSFTVNEADSSVPFILITRKKIKQENILPIGTNAEISPSTLFQTESEYPVHFSFFENPPANIQFQTKISTANIDSAGVVYTLSEDYATYRSNQQNRYFLYRAIFYAVFICLITLFLISISRELSTWKSLLLKLFAITLAWAFFSNIDYGVGWIEIFYALGQQDFLTLKPLVKYGVHALFVLLLTIVCFRPLISSEIELQKQPKITLTLTLVFFGFLCAFLLHFYIIETYSLFTQTSIPVLDLEVFPNWDTLVFYVMSGVFAISCITLLTLLGWFIIKLTVTPPIIPFLFILSGYILGMFIIFELSANAHIAGWISLTTGIFFGTILSFVFLANRDPDLFTYASRLRLLLLFSFISVGLSYIAVYKGYSERLNGQMQRAAELFVDEEATQAERIARSLLTGLERSVSNLTEEDLNQRPAFVENYFTQQTQQLITEEWERFSISTQLVNNNGDIIGEYSSDLDSPAWTRAFNIMSLVIPFEEEQIRLENLRPIVRERPLNEANSNYSSFRRAWIPLYENGSSPQRIGWILCSVYRERPQFEKPLRAVIASEGSENWNASISITEYVNGLASRRNIVGIPLEMPGYLRLPGELIEDIVVEDDSTMFRTAGLGDQQIREFFIATSSEKIIRAATNHPGLDNHLFSLLRFFFCVLITGLLVLGSLFWKKDLNILGHNRRFRDRLIDRFVFASLLCLMALIATTYYAIKSQNQKSVQDQLLDKLGNLTDAISLQEKQSPNASPIPLSELTSTLDADAALYKDKTINTSTTSQIYNQHLLPRILPWDVYDSIYNRGNSQVTRKAILGNQELLIGYQPWLNTEGSIAGIVAIPTFLEAPKFNEQLLSTTSYLLGFYVIIFGLFIIAASLISTQLTSPLEALREGLKKISGGDLETTLPVKSKDEIGSLTNAYNVMVYRLKDLQKDLARAEREAAWKEMAQQVAHEIKNPLTPMKLNLQHLERQLNVSEDEFKLMKPKIEKIAANMIEQIESLSQIASDFSKFARPTDQEFKPVEMNELIASVAELYEPEENLTIKTELHQGKLRVLGVKDELRRTLINLVKNAHEAMPEGGKVTLTTALSRAKDKAVISVKDNGEGIPKETQGQIFVPNFSTKSSGTGLGLAITKKVIEAHDGEISFASEKGKGTTFIIHLPLDKTE
ncbi:MAG: HAMP domain-containing protein [Gracilimonas sp.]|uniref:sensor histidine kinase n=1 Tax=Gracilimonas TaxID=649462 RepID=UPI001B1243F8|nr:HAMP domain-containing sensor histidine kinase [Gracilimonas sp.]MBO6585260.1 HAMP domain-containing protein [Gracilimonas sp.]MBO6615468.1 HAMP domain-containing protein [Gracilimonas sp.]